MLKLTASYVSIILSESDLSLLMLHLGPDAGLELFRNITQVAPRRTFSLSSALRLLERRLS